VLAFQYLVSLALVAAKRDAVLTRSFDAPFAHGVGYLVIVYRVASWASFRIGAVRRVKENTTNAAYGRR
jgi:hypothetical protein